MIDQCTQASPASDAAEEAAMGDSTEMLVDPAPAEVLRLTVDGPSGRGVHSGASAAVSGSRRVGAL